LILAYGAGITSLGLALATWVSRLGRAVAICVTTVVVLSIGWVFLLMVLCQPNIGMYLAMGSPVFGIALATIAVSSEPHIFPGAEIFQLGVCTLLWIMIHDKISTLLFEATVATFDRCMERVRETEGSPIPARSMGRRPIMRRDLETIPTFHLAPSGE
jgi:hypothetical protein